MPSPVETIVERGKLWDRWRCEQCARLFLRPHRKTHTRILAHVYCSRACAAVANKRLTAHPDGTSCMMRPRLQKAGAR